MPPTPPHPVAVLGAGIVGLTTAVRILERSTPVTVYAARRSPRIASAAAPAMFTPYAGSNPARSRAWAETSLRVYAELERREGPRAGVRTGPLREYCYHAPKPSPFADLINERPTPTAAPGVSAVLDSDRPHFDTTRLLAWLEARVVSLGGRIVEERIESLDALLARGHSIVVNCSGVGARELAPDPTVRAMRGVVLHCRYLAGLTRSLHDDAPNNIVTYVFKYDDHLVLGSTYERDVWEETIDDAAIAAIVDRCRALARLDDQPGWSEIGRDPIERRVGLRPVRGLGNVCEDIRLEAEARDDGTIIHNYGHGRSGISLAWGTAAEAADLVAQHLPSRSP